MQMCTRTMYAYTLHHNESRDGHWVNQSAAQRKTASLVQTLLEG